MVLRLPCDMWAQMAYCMVFHDFQARDCTARWIVGLAKWMRWACGLQNARGEQGNTALHLAASRGHVAAVKMLLSKGATTVSSAT